MNIAVIFAGGTGSRMNTRSMPKQFLEMHGKPVLIYTMEHFQNHIAIDSIILVCISSWINYARKIVDKYHISKLVQIVPGGETGQMSIFNGLKAAYERYTASDDVVLIHDGVRPLIDEKTITDCLDTVKKSGNAITTTPAIETIFANSTAGHVGEIYNRSKCLMARAPQCFYLHDIYKTHIRAQKEKKLNFIDSAMMMQHYGMELHTVNGPIENIKITTPIDFYLFRALLDAKENMQIVGL